MSKVELRRRYAACFEPSGHPYDPLLDDFEPGMTTLRAKRLLAELREGLVPLVAAVAERADAIDDSIWVGGGRFAVGGQQRLTTQLMRLLPLPPGSWRLDPTLHPFATSIAHGDIRLTTRYDPDDLSFAFFSALHEAGHGIYEAGVPGELRRGPIGHPTSLGFHESQSRLWENWVGRSRPFLEQALPLLADEFGDPFAGVDAERLYRAANRVRPSLIRVEADEVTYNLHIALRFELEIELFEGGLEAGDLAEAWNARTMDYLGLAVPDHAHGVMQDVHWAAGSFGYFPTYALGNIIAAQLWDAAAAELGDPEQLMDTLNQGQSIPQGAPGDPSAAGAPPSDELGQFASVVLASTEDTWNGLFQRMGRRYQEPTLVLFNGSVRSACGFATGLAWKTTPRPHRLCGARAPATRSRAKAAGFGP